MQLVEGVLLVPRNLQFFSLHASTSFQHLSGKLGVARATKGDSNNDNETETNKEPYIQVVNINFITSRKALLLSLRVQRTVW